MSSCPLPILFKYVLILMFPVLTLDMMTDSSLCGGGALAAWLVAGLSRYCFPLLAPFPSHSSSHRSIVLSQARLNSYAVEIQASLSFPFSRPSLASLFADSLPKVSLCHLTHSSLASMPLLLPLSHRIPPSQFPCHHLSSVILSLHTSPHRLLTECPHCYYILVSFFDTLLHPLFHGLFPSHDFRVHYLHLFFPVRMIFPTPLSLGHHPLLFYKSPPLPCQLTSTHLHTRLPHPRLHVYFLPPLFTGLSRLPFLIPPRTEITTIVI